MEHWERSAGSINDESDIEDTGYDARPECDSYYDEEEYDFAVRRLTPTECERLQGFPDGWKDGIMVPQKNGKLKPAADSARYKLYGNGIALPCLIPIMFGIRKVYEDNAVQRSD